MIIPAELVGGLGIIVPYLATSLFWWGFYSSTARAALQKAERWRKRYGPHDADVADLVQHAEESARRAQVSLLWLPWICRETVNRLRTTQGDLTELRQGTTVLQQEQRQLEIERLERRVERLRREQEGTDPGRACPICGGPLTGDDWQ